jgi:uncharacterized protein (TIGR03067 family)
MRICGLFGALVCWSLVFGSDAPEAPRQTAKETSIAALIRQLGHNRFAQREAASQQLLAIGEPALPALRQAAASSDDLETRLRAEQLVGDITRRLFALVARKELARWQGAWEGNGGNLFVIKGDRWSWGLKGAKPICENIIEIVEIRDKMTLADLQVRQQGHPQKGQTCKAIFRLEGDTLHYCGTYDLPRPTAFLKGRGNPFYVEWKRVRK